MNFLDRLNFQTKISLVTFVMVVLVVVAGVVTIESVVVPVMERELQEAGWRIARGVVEQIRGVPLSSGEDQVKAKLALIFNIWPNLLYVELLDKEMKPVLWMGDEQYRSVDERALLAHKKDGSLFMRPSNANGPIYEILFSPRDESSDGYLSAVRIGVSARSVERLNSQLLWVLLSVALMIFVASFFLTRWFTHMITLPVGRLLHMTHALARGDLDSVLKEVKDTPPCWERLTSSSLVRGVEAPEFCPLLREEADGGPRQSTLSANAPCNECHISRYSGKDELSRLIFAFEFMAARIRVYQEELRVRFEFEERLFEACPDGIMASDSQGSIILYNRGAENLLGYTQGEALQQLHAQNVYTPGEARAIKKALLGEEWGGPGVLLDYMTQVVRKDGKIVPIRLSAIMLSREGGEVAIVGYFHDLTELKEHMDALREVNGRLNRANKELAGHNRRYLEMLSFVTHELKSPVANSYMSANALRQEIFGGLAPEQSVMVEAICRNLDQSMDMIRHYLDLSRIEKDEMAVNPVPTRLLSQVVEPVMKGLSSAIQERNATVAVDADANLEWTLDPELFRGVLTNLLSNALKYGEKSGKIRVSITAVGGRCRMEVWNSGQGIRAEDRDKLFRKFQRLQSSQQSSTRGTGLGLFITRTVVERHGGKIWVESEEGGWTNFIIELPGDK